MRYKQQSAYKTLNRAKYEYTTTFKRNKQLLINGNIYRQSLQIIRNEKNKQRREYRNKRYNKVKHLERINEQNINKQNQQQDTNEIEGIIIADQTIPDNYVPEIKKYGNAKLKPEEEEALKLPPKYCIFNQVNKLECQIEAEKCLCKLRWTSKDYEEYTGELDISNYEENNIDNNVLINNVTNSQNKTNGNPFENEIDKTGPSIEQIRSSILRYFAQQIYQINQLH